MPLRASFDEWFVEIVGQHGGRRQHQGVGGRHQGAEHADHHESDQAREAYDAALACFREAGDGRNECLARNNLANLLRDLGEAEQALERGSAQEGSLAQEQASRQLQELSEQLAEGKGGGDPSQPTQQEGGDGGHVEGPVRIPGADEFQGPAERRRSLLDAMREGSPPGFEKAVGRYYEELLR